MKVALHSVLAAGRTADYLRDHARVPDDLVASFTRVGIHDWSIWRSGEHLFHVVDCDDFGAAMRALVDDPANRRWQEFIGPLVRTFCDGEDNPAPGPVGLPEVWRLTGQDVDGARR